MIRLIVLVLICCLVTIDNASAQQPLKHKAHFFTSPQGKLYINKSLPLYLYLSDKPNGQGTMYQLKSDSTPAYANPMYLDTEGYNSFRSPSAVDTTTKEIVLPFTDIIFDTYADGIAPSVKIDFSQIKQFKKDNKTYISGNEAFNLTSKDAGSGVEQILISIDSAGFKPYTQPVVFPTEKLYDLNFYAVDNVGNISDVQHFSFNIDKNAPVTQISFEGNKFENTISGKTRIALMAEDNLSGVSKIEYIIDKGQAQTYYQPINAALLTEGEHTLTYYSVDNVGNTETGQQFIFFVDKTPPLLVDEIMGNSFMINGKEYSSGRSKLKLTAVDNKAGIKMIKYSINDEEFQEYSQPFYLTSVSGSLSVKSYAEDNVGNRSEASEKSTRSQVSYVDLTGPQLKYTFSGKIFRTRDTVFINRETKFNLSALDNEAGIKGLTYSIDDGAETTYEKPFAIDKDGMHQVFIYGYDNVDNSNREAVTIVVDNKGPEIFSRFSILPVDKKLVNGQEVDVYSNQAVLFLSATDARVAIDRIYYKINDEPEKMFTGMIEGFKLGRDYSIKVRALDKLGNENTIEVVFATDNTGPQIFTRFSINPSGSQQIDNQPVDVYPAHVSLFLSVTNSYIAYDKIYYSINGGAERSYQGIIDGFKPGTKVKPENQGN